MKRTIKQGFTLTELLVVIGLIAMLISLVMPVMTKARAAASATTCMSNLRQMGQAWEMYTAENRGRLMEYIWSTPTTPDVSYRGYWLGILDSYRVRGDALLCPVAREPISYSYNKGCGNVAYAWNGKYATIGTPMRFNIATYRTGSYGYNGYLTAGNGFGHDGKSTRITGVKRLTEVPVLMDAIYPDLNPLNGTEALPAKPPPNLRGANFPLGFPDHWLFLIGRHGRGINSYMADGSCRWVPLEETYTLMWKSDWKKYLLRLPRS
jgi:prepilin-type N-terminal cleavage/methylation domain-containing protein